FLTLHGSTYWSFLLSTDISKTSFDLDLKNVDYGQISRNLDCVYEFNQYLDGKKTNFFENDQESVHFKIHTKAKWNGEHHQCISPEIPITNELLTSYNLTLS